ncbi:MAG: DUF5683 domain-containing protein [Saprospiraceae bacterium]
MKVFILLFLFGFIVSSSASGQDVVAAPDSTATGRPSASVTRKRFKASDYPNPRKAVLFSIVPGGGQIYNRRWWKVPIVYGGIGASAGVLIYNADAYKRLRDNYRWMVDGDPNTTPVEPYSAFDPEALRRFRDQSRGYVELSGIIFGFAYLLSVADAYVDAHLASFDVSDDLTLRLRPSIQGAPAGPPALGLGIRCAFDKHPPSAPHFVR